MEMSECDQFTSRTDISKISNFEGLLKFLVIRFDGLPYDLLWRVSLSVLEISKIWLPWLNLNENQWNILMPLIGFSYTYLNYMILSYTLFCKC